MVARVQHQPSDSDEFVQSVLVLDHRLSVAVLVVEAFSLDVSKNERGVVDRQNDRSFLAVLVNHLCALIGKDHIILTQNRWEISPKRQHKCKQRLE